MKEATLNMYNLKWDQEALKGQASISKANIISVSSLDYENLFWWP